MPTVIIPPTDVSPNTGTGSEVLSNSPTLVNPIVTGTIDVSGNITAADLILGTSGPSTKSSLSARASRQGLVFDGTTGASVSVPAMTDGSVAFWVNPSLAGANNFPVIGAVGSYSTIYITPAGRVVNEGDGATYTSTLTANKWGFCVVTKSGNAITYYINGVSVGNYTQTNPWNASNSVGKLNYNSWAASLSGLYVYNRALSASEVVALYEAGAPSGADYRSPAAGTALITGADSNFSSDTGFWTKSGTAAITGGKAVLVNAGDYFVRNYILQVGQRYRATATISGYTGGTIWFTDANGNGVTATANGTYTADFVATSTSIYMGGPSAVASFDDVTLVPLGLLLAPDAAQAGGGLVWYDTSGNAANISWTSGVSWNVPTSGYVTSGSSLNLAAGGTNQNITLTPSGTGIVTIGGAARTIAAAAGILTIQAPSHIIFNANGANEVGRFLTNGNLLLKSDGIDSGNGKLQLATHSSYTGGIGFGPDISLYRKGPLVFGMNGVSDLFVESTGAGLWLGSAAGVYEVGLTRVTNGIYFKTGSNTLALNLDSSQNATFAKDIFLGTSGPSVKSTLSARAPAQGLVFGGTAGATVSGPALGTGDFTVVAWVNPNSVAALQALISGNTNSFSLDIAAGGLMEVRIAGGAILGTASSALVAGKTQMASVRRSGSTNTFNINGVDLASPFTDTSNFTQVISTVGSFFGGGYPFTGSLRVLIYNRALSAAEIVALYESGAPVAADYNSASNTSIATSSFVNGNSGGAYLYDTYSGASATGFTAVKTQTTTEADAYSGNTFSVVKGQQFLVTFTCTLTSGTLPFLYLSDWAGSPLYNSASPITAGSFSRVITATQSGSGVRLRFYNPITDQVSYAISGLSITRLGLLLAPDAAQAGGGYVWNDQSGNLAQIVLPSSGVQWTLPSVAGQRIRGTTSTNGNQQLLGASVLLPAESQILYVRARAQTGTPTITIGTASGGAQIVASVALSTTWLNCTIALTGGIVSSADDIWIGSNSTDVVETDIAFQPLDF